MFEKRQFDELTGFQRGGRLTNDLDFRLPFLKLFLYGLWHDFDFLYYGQKC